MDESAQRRAGGRQVSSGGSISDCPLYSTLLGYFRTVPSYPLVVAAGDLGLSCRRPSPAAFRTRLVVSPSLFSDLPRKQQKHRCGPLSLTHEPALLRCDQPQPISITAPLSLSTALIDRQSRRGTTSYAIDWAG